MEKVGDGRMVEKGEKVSTSSKEEPLLLSRPYRISHRDVMHSGDAKQQSERACIVIQVFRPGRFFIFEDGFTVPIDVCRDPFMERDFIRFSSIGGYSRTNDSDCLDVQLDNGESFLIPQEITTENGFGLLKFMLNECT